MDDQTAFRFITGQTSEDEERSLLKDYADAPDEFTDRCNDIHAIMDISELEQIGKKLEKRSRRAALRHNAALALKLAAIAAAIVLAVLVTRERTLNSLSDLTATVEAPKGEIIHFTLPDSTVVYLNSGARLQYPVVFRKDCRRVTLSGEALFDVKHEENRPFVVSTFASDVKVLGTRFNILAEEEDSTFIASLLEGKILLTNLLDEREGQLEMHPNDIVEIRGTSLELSSDEEPDICWTRGLVKIGGQNFEELMKDFENAFNVSIVIRREELPDISGVSGKIRINDGIDNALKILQHTAQFGFSRDIQSNVVTIE